MHFSEEKVNFGGELYILVEMVFMLCGEKWTNILYCGGKNYKYHVCLHPDILSWYIWKKTATFCSGNS